MPSPWTKHILFVLGTVFFLYICLEAHAFEYKQIEKEPSEPPAPIYYLPRYGPVPVRFTQPQSAFDRSKLISLESLEKAKRKKLKELESEDLGAKKNAPPPLLLEMPTVGENEPIEEEPTVVPMKVEAGADPQPTVINVKSDTPKKPALIPVDYTNEEDLLLLFKKEIPKGKKTDEKIEVNFAVPNYSTTQPLNSPLLPSKARYQRH